jgi:hypothetical protein
MTNDERLHLVRMAETGNWNIVRGSAASDAELMELLDEGLLVLIYTPHLKSRDMEGVRLTAEGRKWLTRAEMQL